MKRKDRKMLKEKSKQLGIAATETMVHIFKQAISNVSDENIYQRGITEIDNITKKIKVRKK